MTGSHFTLNRGIPTTEPIIPDAPPSGFKLESAQLLRLVEILHQYIFIKNEKGEFIFVNGNFAGLFGLSPDGIYGKTDYDFFYKEAADAFTSKDEEIRKTKISYAAVEHLRFPHGSEMDIWVNKTALLDSNQNVIGIQGIFVDISKKLQADQEHLRNRINNLVHEVSLPIQAICSNLENVKNDCRTGRLNLTKKEILAALEFCYSQVHILGTQAENMQKALLGAKELPYIFREGSIQPIIADCISLFSSAGSKRKVRFASPQNRHGKSYPRLEMSRPDLFRAFKNLYHNALKYSYSGVGLSSDNSPHATRWISTTLNARDAANFSVSISNYGVGILPDELPRVFEEGYRGKLSIDRHRTGAGLGLSEAKKVIERHGGTIEIDCKRMGGPFLSTVTVTLPYRQTGKAYRYE